MLKTNVTWLRAAALLCAAGCSLPTWAIDAAAQELLTKYGSMEGRLRVNQFNQPLVLDSLEASNRVTGEIHAVISHPFVTVRTNLNDAGHWCDVISLHINTKYCRAVVAPNGTILKVNIGNKTPQDLKDASRLEFKYKVLHATERYLDIKLSAQDGPMGSSDYRIELEAIPLPNAQTFLHFTYSYAMSFPARLAMQTYLATIGNGKLGFTETGPPGNGQPQYIGGVRALIERNTMRYYLAIDSFLASASEANPSTRLEKRLQSWFSAVEQYPLQLHEVDRAAYLSMKHDEYVRQQTAD
ncbi:MAG: hypothetical protein IPH35_08830 [Rhodoferax sp.]|nr:hypothetical protein [Rhodoferax sp.]